MTINTYQPGPYEPTRRATMQRDAGRLSPKGGLLGAVVFTVLAVLAWLVR